MVLKKVNYWRKNKTYLETATCEGCDKPLREDYHNEKPIWIKWGRNKRTYYCDKCEKRLYGGVSLWKDYPEEAIVI